MRKSGINSNTPKDFLLGAGVVFKNFKYVYTKVEIPESEDPESEEVPEGALQVVEDGEKESDTTIQLKKLNLRMSLSSQQFFQTAKAFPSNLILV